MEIPETDLFFRHILDLVSLLVLVERCGGYCDGAAMRYVEPQKLLTSGMGD